MALTVTATASGTGLSNGMALTVKVINNAAATQNGKTGNSTTVTTPQLAITPNATGSWVYGAVTNGGGSTSYTANGSTTFSQNVTDATHGSAYGTFRTTSTTTAATPVTVGGSAPTETAGNLFIALAEILNSGTLAEDASSPAGVNTTAAHTLTTASFTPPGSSILVAMVSSNFSGSGTLSIALSDSASAYTWTQLAGTGTDNLASVWLGTPASITSTGSLSLSGMSMAGSGTAAISATGSLSLSGMSMAGSGTAAISATGSLSLSGMSMSGSAGPPSLLISIAGSPGNDPELGDPYNAGVYLYGATGSLAGLTIAGGTAQLQLLPSGPVTSVSKLPAVFAAALGQGLVNERMLLVLTTGKESGNPDGAIQLFSASADNTIAAQMIIEFGGAIAATITVTAAAFTGAVQPGNGSSSGAGIWSGSGAPTLSGTAGDLYIRTNGTTGSYLYRCSGGTSWTAIL